MQTNNSSRSYSRRRFIKTTGTAAIAAPIIIRSSLLNGQSQPPSDRINLGIIGCGGMGMANLNACLANPNVVVTAACDIWKERLDPVVERFKNTCTGYTDFRQMLLRKDLDAVIISTPAHWHAIMAIAACKAGKDIYLQKPMTMHLGESLAVRNAVKKHKIICQVGTQIHASENYRRVVELIRSGNLGEIGTVRTFFVMNEGPKGIGLGNNSMNIPKGMDWDMWVDEAHRTIYVAAVNAEEPMYAYKY